jgi:hypothetical protein
MYASQHMEICDDLAQQLRQLQAPRPQGSHRRSADLLPKISVLNLLMLARPCETRKPFVVFDTTGVGGLGGLGSSRATPVMMTKENKKSEENK